MHNGSASVWPGFYSTDGVFQLVAYPGGRLGGWAGEFTQIKGTYFDLELGAKQLT